MAKYTFDAAGDVPFGEIQGYAPGGIPAYSNKHEHFFSGERSVDDNLFCGFKYQCVEFARRWLLERKGLVLPDVNWACHIFQLREVADAETAEAVPVRTVMNGSNEKPTADSLIIYASSESNIVGHVGAITEVSDDKVYVADQNYRFHRWEGSYASALQLTCNNGLWTVIDDLDPNDVEVPLGWVTFPGRENREEGAPPVKLHPSLYFNPPPKPYLLRKTFHPTQQNAEWLDTNNFAEKLFIEEFGMDVSRSRIAEADASYYEMNQEMHLMCTAYGVQLHGMFMEATAQVIASDEQLTIFGIPRDLWPRLRHSWENHRTYISGRFDFAFNNDTGALKCFEYNADSASTMLECGRIQEKWAQSIGLAETSTRGAGFFMDRNLRAAWAKSGATGLVHFLVDDDKEEMYTAAYCMENAEAVGLRGKLCVKFSDFHFDAEGRVRDRDDERVRVVWKTWMWETAIADRDAAAAERGDGWRPTPESEVRLCDLVLSDDWDILVFEPMWKLIPSNKAILPIIYHNHPDHPAMLKSEYELTDELRKTGFAKKPIVGRVGRNVTITAQSGDVEAESRGNFGERDMIYQELFSLTKQDDYYAIMGGWMFADSYSGTGIREDKTVITGVESPFAAIRIKLDKIPRPLTRRDLDKMAEDE